MLVQWFETGCFEAPVHPCNCAEELGAIPEFDVTSDFRTWLLGTLQGVGNAPHFAPAFAATRSALKKRNVVQRKLSQLVVMLVE